MCHTGISASQIIPNSERCGTWSLMCHTGISASQIVPNSKHCSTVVHNPTGSLVTTARNCVVRDSHTEPPDALRSDCLMPQIPSTEGHSDNSAVRKLITFVGWCTHIILSSYPLQFKSSCRRLCLAMVMSPSAHVWTTWRLPYRSREICLHGVYYTMVYPKFSGLSR